MSLAGKVALVTGGSSGIGLETSKLFAKEGAKVCLAARREAELQKAVDEITAAGGEAMYVKTDVTDPEQITAMVQACVDKFGKLDILFNNAGWEGPTMFPEPSGLPSLDTETILKINAINMTGPLLVARAALVEMQKNGEAGGVIVGNASTAAVMPLEFGALCPVYHPTKAYMDALTRMLAAAHGEAVGGHIKAYNVNPGAVLTDMWENIFDGMPAYGKPMLEAMGVDTAEKWASAFGAVNGSPDRERPYMIAADIAAVVLAFANGTTKYKTGEGVIVAPGCTYANWEFYPAIYQGFDMVNGGINGEPPLKPKMKDWAGNLLYPGEAAAADAAAAMADAAPAPTSTTTTTTTTASDGTTTTTTVTVTAGK